MRKISFRIVPHSILPGVEVVQILLDNEMCATIYPDEKKWQTINIVSAHFAGALTSNDKFPEGVKMNTGEKTLLPVPAVCITFDVRHNTMGRKKIVRIE